MALDYLCSISRSNPEYDRPRRLVLLEVNQELAESPRLRVSPELSDPVGSLEVGEHEDVEQLGAGERVRGRLRARRPSCSGRPYDPSTFRHAGQCEHRYTSDLALLRAILKVRDGAGGRYWWVECATCE